MKTFAVLLLALILTFTPALAKDYTPEIKWINYLFCVDLDVEQHMKSPFDIPPPLPPDGMIYFTTGTWSISLGDYSCAYYIKMGIKKDGTVVWRIHEEEKEKDDE